MAIDDTVSLSIDGQSFSGWETMRVTRGIERMPSDFQMTLTERYPGQTGLLQIKPGQSCRLLLGASIVLTGWVDRVIGTIDPQGHHITILGRGRCCDLVDCSAFANNRQFLDHSVLDIARLVAAPFRISVYERDPGTPALPRTQFTASGQIVPQFNVNLTQTPWEIIESTARYACLIAYEDTAGDLVLAQVGTAAAASGFQSGVNVQAASCSLSMDQRYSTVWALRLAIDDQFQLTPGAPAPGAQNANVVAQVDDKTVRGPRPLVIISEQGFSTEDITKRRAQWEIARRSGRSQVVTIVADNWRDGSGALWTPNTLAPVEIPELHLTGLTWLIAEVSFGIDAERGRVAEVTLMPPEAFTPQAPAVLYNGSLDLAVETPTPPPTITGAAGMQGHA